MITIVKELNSYTNGAELDFDQEVETCLLGGAFNMISAYLASTSHIISSTGKTILDH